MNNALALRPSYWASVSGGKDSLFMLRLILNNLNRYRLDGVIHFELEIDFPFIKDVIDYMESECKRFNIPFVRIKPRKTWQELYEKYGFPTRQTRWCNNKYKLDANKQICEYLQSKGCYCVQYIGYCADEVERYKKRNQTDEIYPLVEFGINENEILQWAKDIPVFNDYYKYNKRCGCMYCPMQSMANSAYILKYYPDEYAKMMYLIKETELKREEELHRPFSVFSGNPKYNAEYRDKRVREVYLPNLARREKSIQNTKWLDALFEKGGTDSG